MDTTAWISLAAISISLASVGIVQLRKAHRPTRRKPRPDASDHFISGDHPAVPNDFKVRHNVGRTTQ